MKLLVLGASGRCGRWLVRAAVDRGYDVTAVLRPGSPHEPPAGVTLLRGEVTDRSLLAEALDGSEAVLSCLGLRRAGASPWARLLSPPDLVQRVMGSLASLLDADGDRRLVWISAGGVGSSRSRVTGGVARVISSGNVGVAYRDLEAAEAVLRARGTPALAVRPVTLVNGRPTGRTGPVDRYGFFSMVRRSDVATWMLDVADGTGAFEGSDVLLGTRW